MIYFFYRGSELIKQLNEYSTETNTIVKHYYSGFKKTNLHDYLKSKNIDTLIFCGLTTNTCIKATILDAIKLGYKIKLIDECVISTCEKNKIKAISELTQIYKVEIIYLNEFTNDFNIYCCGDTFIINDFLPLEIYSENMLDELIRECEWKSMKINGGTLSRDIDVQANIINDLIPTYRNPSDEYIVPHKPSQKIEKIFNYLNNFINLKNINNDKITFNHVFIKFYKSYLDGIGRHTDKTLDLDKNSFVANLSIGSTRKMLFRSKVDNTIQEVQMKSNSVLFIGMETNKKWLHEVKPLSQEQVNQLQKKFSDFFNGKRMSLTFRTACTYYDSKLDKLIGQGSPKYNLDIENKKDIEQDRINLIKAFSEENKQYNFDWEKNYGNGFYSLHT